MNNSLKIIIVADNASRKMGGEAILPYHYYRVMRSREIDVRLVVHERVYKELIESFPQDSGRISYVKDLWIHKFLNKWIKPLIPHRLRIILVAYPILLLTQLQQRSLIRKLIASHPCDVVHQPIPVSPKITSLIYNVGAPVVIGPMNGGMNYPPGLAISDSLLEGWGVGLGRSFSGLMNLIIPGKRKASILLVANERTRKALPPGVSKNISILVENGVDLSLWQSTEFYEQPHSSKPIFLFIGRLVALKAVDILLDAAKKVLDSRPIEIRVIGDGEDKASLESQAERLGITESVTFLGFLTQEHIVKELIKSTALVLPSLHECGGAVVLEAMASARPVIATKWGGPVDYISKESGFLIEPTSREDLVNGFAEAILKLSNNPKLCQTMGEQGRKRVVKYFDWERKVDKILSIYENVVTPGND